MCKNFAFTGEEYFEDNFTKQKVTLAKCVTKAHRQRKLKVSLKLVMRNQTISLESLMSKAQVTSWMIP